MSIRFWALTLALFLPSATAARAGSDRVAWMAERLISGKDILDYERALGRFVEFADPRVLPTLLKLSEADDPVVRAEAAGVLWHYNTKEVREKLLERSRDRLWAVRVEAAKSLCLMRYTASMEIILEALSSRSPAVRTRALRALAAIGDADAEQAARRLRRSRSAFDRVWAAFALYRMGQERQAQLDELQRHLLGFPRAAWLPGVKDPDRRHLRRAAKLAAANVEVRLAASNALSRIGDERALAVLALGTADVATAQHPDGAQRQLRLHRDLAAKVCAGAVRSERVLVRLGAARVARRLQLDGAAAKQALAEALGTAVGDPARLVRLAALRAIGELGLSSQVEAVERALRTADDATRRVTALTLGRLGEDRNLGPLLQALERERHKRVRRGLYRAIAMLKTPRAVEPMLDRLKSLARQRRQAGAAEELPWCIAALASAGERAATRVLRILPEAEGEKRKLLHEVLAHTGAGSAFDFFLDVLRESPPLPDAPAVRFFDSLDARFAPRLKRSIETETAMWIRIVLARALHRLGETGYGRGILWGMRHEEAYYRRLAAALARGLSIPGSVEPMIERLADEPKTAWYAARTLMTDGSPRAVAGLLAGLRAGGLRRRHNPPIRLFWEGQRSARKLYVKEVDNERVWVLFAEDRIGGELDLFLTWSADGQTWTEPVFTGLTSFADPGGRVPPPTFSLKVRGRDITIGLTHTFARSSDPDKPRFKTRQRVYQHKWQDFFRDQDGDGLNDVQEKARFTHLARKDSDGDGLVDGEDKNPLARPASPRRDEDVVKLLAFSHALLVTERLPTESHLLVVEDTPGQRRAPELPTWPWLVLHLKPGQAQSLWSSTGGGYPRVKFGRTEIHHRRGEARQSLELHGGPNDSEQVEVLLARRDGQWVVTGIRQAD